MFLKSNNFTTCKKLIINYFSTMKFICKIALIKKVRGWFEIGPNYGVKLVFFCKHFSFSM